MNHNDKALYKTVFGAKATVSLASACAEVYKIAKVATNKSVPTKGAKEVLPSHFP
jgi:hypothetical protein